MLHKFKQMLKNQNKVIFSTVIKDGLEMVTEII